MPVTSASSRAPYVALDPSTSIGLGHLVRVAGLRALLHVSSRVIGRYDAELGTKGFKISRRLLPRRNEAPAVWVVDSGHLSEAVIRHKLTRRNARVVWIRRGLFHAEQAAIQGGYLDFVDLVLRPAEIEPEAPDAVDQLAAGQGKLQQVGICHAYQAMPPGTDAPRPHVFLGLGGFEPQQRPLFAELHRRLQRARTPYVWSSHDFRPILSGFPAHRRIPVAQALAHKATAAGAAVEAGYNSVYEALRLGHPVLLLANEGRGREAQRRRVAMAKAVSPLVFDAEAPGEMARWIEAVSAGSTARHIPEIVGSSRGLQDMATHIEGVFTDATAVRH